MTRETVIKFTKYVLDFIYFAVIVVTVSLPITIEKLGEVLEKLEEHYVESVVIYIILGVSAAVILGELRKMFSTVIKKDCFVRVNVVSLHKMFKWSFIIVVMAIIRSMVYVTPAMLVIILVFAIAGLFSKVLSFVFEEAVGYKEENDFTI